MAGVRSGNQHSIDFGRAAHLLSRIKGEWNIELPRRLLRFVQSTPRKGSDAAVLCQRKPRHQPFDRMQSKPENPKANQRVTVWRGRPRPRLLNLVLILSQRTMMPPGVRAAHLAGEGARAT